MAKADFNLEHVKFYLAFENAYHCDDYISEKFWRNALTNRAVPIVFGPSIADVDEIAPPQSYIHAEWFSSPELLVKYVHWLADNDKQYLGMISSSFSKKKLYRWDSNAGPLDDRKYRF